MATVFAWMFGVQLSGILDFFFRFLTALISPPTRGIKGVTSSFLLWLWLWLASVWHTFGIAVALLVLFVLNHLA